MKRILITGKNSYIGTSFEKWMKKYGNQYQIDTIDLRNNDWKRRDFSRYDCVIHTAAIVHSPRSNDSLYFEINRDLTIDVANKAKENNISQFIFLSSMSIFGKTTGIISNSTKPQPNTAYGKSKLEAEKELRKLEDSNFKVAVLRPPVVYGINSKGNYTRLSKLAKKILFFPKVENERSMIYIDNLCSFIYIVLKHEFNGVFHPQNDVYVNTSNLVEKIAKCHQHRIYFLKFGSYIIKKISSKNKLIGKIFGSLFYDDTTLGYPNSNYNGVILNYNQVDFEESIKQTELGERYEKSFNYSNN